MFGKVLNDMTDYGCNSACVRDPSACVRGVGARAGLFAPLRRPERRRAHEPPARSCDSACRVVGVLLLLLLLLL